MTAVAFFLKNQPGEYEREARLLLHSLHRVFRGNTQVTWQSHGVVVGFCR